MKTECERCGEEAECVSLAVFVGGKWADEKSVCESCKDEILEYLDEAK